MTRRTGLSRAVFAAVAFAALLFGGAAWGQPSAELAELNNEWAAIPDEDRSDLVLAPVLAAMDEAPEAASELIAAALLTPIDHEWSEAESWATAPAQVAALDALKTVTERRSRYVFAQPYGVAAGNAAIDAGLYVDLGEPELLANASLGWFDALDRLGALVQIEATRLGNEGEGAAALDLLTRWVRFARSFADRPFYAEKLQALDWMVFALERMRDIVYLFPTSLDDAEMRAAIRELADRELNIDRILFPKGERLAAMELLSKTFVKRGGPNPSTFGPTMAQLGASGRPLRLFSEAARWRDVAATHANYFDTRDEITAIFRDWALRWDLGPHDVVWEQPTDYDRLDTRQFALIDAVVPNMIDLFNRRLDLRTELGGTRLALAIVGYKEWGGSWPNPVFAVRPRFIPEIPIDPWDVEQDDPYRFFVPIRDQPSSERVQPGPHVMTVNGWSAHLSGEGLARTASAGSALSSLTGDAASAAAKITVAMDENMIRGMVLGQLKGLAHGVVTTENAKSISQKMAYARADGGVAITDVDRGVMRLLQTLDEINGRPLNRDEATTILEQYSLAMINAPETARALDDLRAGRELSAQQIRAVFDASLAPVLRQQFGSGPEDAAAPATDSTFKVTLDDSSFVLYSVGEDGAADRAAQVGPGGTDILMWPPLISLVREQLRGD